MLEGLLMAADGISMKEIVELVAEMLAIDA
jgi:hypothetical protein